jgi:hypothetical protein
MCFSGFRFPDFGGYFLMSDNCFKCSYSKVKENVIECKRPLSEGRMAYITLDKAELKCPCNSRKDQLKKVRWYVDDDGLFTVSYHKLIELQKIIFGE